MESNVKKAMLQATKYMVEQVSTNGGYARLYTEDLSRRWHELEAYDTQIRIEEPGSLGMGHLFLDAYHVTADEYYYEAALKLANALIRGQLDCGGWNYFIDFAGDRSLKEWYRTIGKNAWGFEEHYYYYGNATFDDNVTPGAAGFLLRVYLEKLDPQIKPSLDKAIQFVLDAQYPIGGWPQRYPLMHNHPKDGKADYSSFYTFNDDVMRNTTQFLIDCYATLGEERLLEPIYRAMNFYLITQQGNPQGGWAQQYDMQLQPAHARSFEPASIVTGQTYDNILMLLKFYRYTGDRKFLARIPDAIAWLERARLPQHQTDGGKRTHSFFVEIDTNKPLWAHREGTGVNDSKYWVDYGMDNLYSYGHNMVLNIEMLKKEYEQVNALAKEEATRNSPLVEVEGRNRYAGKYYFQTPDRNVVMRPSEIDARNIIDALDTQHRWLSKHEWISSPYSIDPRTGQETNTAMHADRLSADWKLDPSDQQYISVAVYVKNMRLLMDYLSAQH
ncbi:pectate lyase [Parapedobacter lycopersici]|uniref:pectate lyase n=1 Tax=Parapedobacter lycopersici TaxID=1864939 RepID=UPI00333ED4E1